MGNISETKETNKVNTHAHYIEQTRVLASIIIIANGWNLVVVHEEWTKWEIGYVAKLSTEKKTSKKHQRRKIMRGKNQRKTRAL